MEKNLGINVLFFPNSLTFEGFEKIQRKFGLT
jgi:hypothetical protein